MKTPREILLEKHKVEEARLDKISEQVVAEHLATASHAKRLQPQVLSPMVVAMKLWQELVWPCRRIWAGMAVVWVVVLVLCLGAREQKTAVTENAPPPTADVMMALKEQRQMMAQLLDAAPPETITRPRIPGPRSEWRQTITTV
jgi:hypothetical protein